MIGRVYLHACQGTEVAGVNNAAHEDDYSRTDVATSHYVLPVEIKNGVAACYVFSKNHRDKYLPVRTMTSAPKRMNGIQFQTVPRCFTGTMWLQTHAFCLAAIDTLLPVGDESTKITLNDWGLILMHEPTSRMFDVAPHVATIKQKQRQIYNDATIDPDLMWTRYMDDDLVKGHFRIASHLQEGKTEHNSAEQRIHEYIDSIQKTM